MANEQKGDEKKPAPAPKLRIRYNGPKGEVYVPGVFTGGVKAVFKRGKIVEVPKAAWSEALIRQAHFHEVDEKGQDIAHPDPEPVKKEG